MNHNKGQGALEYLLLIGGAIIVAVIVVTLLLNLGGQSTTSTVAQDAGAQCGIEAAGDAYQGQFNCNSEDTAKVYSPRNKDTGVVEAAIGDDTTRRILVGGKCFQCYGQYANCNAREEPLTSSSINTKLFATYPNGCT